MGHGLLLILPGVAFAAGCHLAGSGRTSGGSADTGNQRKSMIATGRTLTGNGGKLSVPPIDADAPERVETATFALG